MTPGRRPPATGRRAPDGRPSPTDRSAELTSLIRAEIESSPGRHITFARYMERALYEPGLGYYRGLADRPTEAGDFLTAPETHAIFGWTLARRVEAIWVELGRPRRFGLIEYGAGSGTLGLAILDGFRRHGSFDLLQATRYEPIESNPNRLIDLRRRFDEAGFADRLVERPDPSGLPATSSPTGSAEATDRGGAIPVTGVILANEFLDALPVHRVFVRGGMLRELFVAWSEERAGFAEVAGQPSTPELAARLADDGVVLAEGQIAEICLGLGPWLDEAAKRLARGCVLAIDYGFDAAELYGPRRLAGTLLGYRGHRVVENPFNSPGEVDLTAHVDFTAVRRLAARRGFRTVALTTQSEFLVAAGLEGELRAVQASPELSLADYARARSGVVRMLDPRHMGRFRVLILEREDDITAEERSNASGLVP
jgi:SAM-dependent MidA family methyltransferase